ncbi:MAG: hypothetical protein EDM03_03110 [Porphyrobacter sp. IPPAS B-1204]|nr:MAG: hypothetical protein EDM03_03110 [Porphyrobacter sp. IPPAS B-1204]
MKAAGLALAAVLALPAAAQEAEPPPIVVEGEKRQTEEALTDLARDLAGNPRADRPLARFEKPLCLMVAAENAELGREIAARIIDNAKAAKVRVRGSGCSPNALVTFSDDAHSQLREIRKSGRRLFAGLSARELDEALDARDPVYVFQTSTTTAASGQALLRPQPDVAPVNKVFAMGRLSRLTREDMLAALVVIDNGAVAGLGPLQIADYASLRLLAPTGEVDAREAGGPRTIMTLFADPDSAPAAMTRFDRAYLAALYRMPPGSFSKEVLRAAVLDAEAKDEG